MRYRYTFSRTACCSASRQLDDLAYPATQVYEQMQAASVPPTEMTYTALVRVAAGTGNGPRSCQLVRRQRSSRIPLAQALTGFRFFQIAEMRARGLHPKLRTFTPALQCFCETGDIAQVRRKAVRQCPPLRRRLPVLPAARTGGSDRGGYTQRRHSAIGARVHAASARDDKVRSACRNAVAFAMPNAPSSCSSSAVIEGWSLLRRMKEDLRLVGSELLEAVRVWFASLGPTWTAESTTVDEDGAASCQGGIQLQAVRHSTTQTFYAAHNSNICPTDRFDRPRARRTRERHCCACMRTRARTRF